MYVWRWQLVAPHQKMNVIRNLFKRKEAKPVPTQTNPDAYTSDVQRLVVTGVKSVSFYTMVCVNHL